MAQHWVEAFHIISVVAWFSGLLYLPRLFVYHAQATDKISLDRFKIMEKKLYYYIMWPASLLTITLGLTLFSFNPSFYLTMAWMHVKLTLVTLLFIYHVYLGKLVRDFKGDRNKHGQVFYRWINELPALLLIGIVIMVVVKP